MSPLSSTRPSQRLRPNLLTLALAAFGLAHSAQAAVQFELIPATQAWNTITQVGGVPVRPFELAPQAAIADSTTGVTTIPGMPMQANGSAATGSLTVAPGLKKHTMDAGWNIAFTNGYTGPIYSSGAPQITLTLPPRTTAFHVLGEHSDYDSIDLTATSDSGATSSTLSITAVAPPSLSAIPSIGFFTSTPSEAIHTITIAVARSQVVIALFGIAQAPDAPTLNAATPAPGAAQLQVTAPTDVGTHAVTGYLASCTPQAGGAAITATGSASPLTVGGLTPGSAYNCTVAATSAAGTGPASAAHAVTPAARPPATVAPVPGLGPLGLGLLALCSAGLGAVGLRRRAP